jgi:hypothetical protein
MSAIDPTKSKFLNTNQAAAHIGVEPQTLSLWRATGRHVIKFYKIGRKVAYRIEDLDAWLESRARAVEPPTEPATTTA